MFQRSLILVLSLIFTNPVYAHEFWISPVKYEIGIHEPIEAHNRVGQNFVGGSYFFLEKDINRHEVMQAGKIVEQGPTEKVFFEPEKDYTEKLLSAVPIPDPNKEKERYLNRTQKQ